MKLYNHLKDDQKKWTAPELNIWVSQQRVHVIFQFFFFNKSAKMSTILCFSVNMGCYVYINEEKNELKWF